METPGSYAEVEKMIYSGEIMLSDLERLLESLHKQKRITRSQQEALLELAWSRNSRTEAPT